MTKPELIQNMADASHMSKKDAAQALDAFIHVVSAELVKGGKVSLPGFGTFEVSKRAERVGRNPKTGEKVNIPAQKSVKFKPYSLLKECMNG